MKGRNNKKVLILITVIYLLIIACITVIDRSVAIHGHENEVFWSYKAWLIDGDYRTGIQCLENIAFFVPLGFLVAALATKHEKWVALAAGIVVSLFVELGQLYTGRGLCEIDDVMNNSAGALLGGVGFCIVRSMIGWLRKGDAEKALDHAVVIIGLVCVVVGAAVCIWNHNQEGTSRSSMCFQLDAMDICHGEYILGGYCFGYDTDTDEMADDDISIVLKSVNDGTKIELDTEYGLSRPDVDDYFHYDRDFSHSGFRACISADAVDPGEEYEIYVKWGRFELAADTYIRGDMIERIPEAEFSQPDVYGTDLARIVYDGMPLVYRADQHCWVYQYEGSLYWIVDDGFEFEDDGSTYIQYQLWTTQPYNLPQERLDNHWYWDNIGDNFEDYEISGMMDCGKYRVCRREIPTEYAVTEILTGYYADDEWVWQEYFRPVIKGGGVG